MTRSSVRPLAWLALLLAIGGAWAGDPPKGKPADRELERLRGRWRLTACTFEGDEFPADLLTALREHPSRRAEHAARARTLFQRLDPTSPANIALHEALLAEADHAAAVP